MTKQKDIILSPRLQTIANQVKRPARVADIGTDHGYIPIYLVKHKICPYVIASDVKSGPVSRARDNVSKYCFNKEIDVRLGYGLERVSVGEVDTVIIAGMGGVLMCEIMISSLTLLQGMRRLILQPMIGQEEVRKWLEQNHFTIVDEALAAEDHKIYQIIVAEPGKQKIEKEVYYHIGKHLIDKKHPLLQPLLQHKIKEMRQIIQNIAQHSSRDHTERLQECYSRLRDYEEINKHLVSLKVKVWGR